MKEFMAYVQNAFYDSTGWNRDNSYSALNSTADDLLRFRTPQGLRLSLSSLATPTFANSYHLGSVGIVDGSVSFLYSSVPLGPGPHLTPRSDTLHLPDLCRAYRGLSTLPPQRHPLEALKPTASSESSEQAVGNGNGRGSQGPPVMLFGRLYVPQSQLEALLVRRVAPGLQLQLRAVSSDAIRGGGSVLGLAQYDVGKYAVEGLASSDGGLLGLRGVYNFGGDASDSPSQQQQAVPQSQQSALQQQHQSTTGTVTPSSSSSSSLGSENGNSRWSDKERIYGRFTAGAEVYYGTLNKSGGASMGLRFATLPAHGGTPLTAAVTLNPLVGSVGASYAVRAGRFLTLGSRLDFNVYSYDSNWSVGVELWRKEFLRRLEEGPGHDDRKSTTSSGRRRERSFQAKLEWRLDDDTMVLEKKTQEEERKGAAPGKVEDEFGGMVKARFDQNTRIGLLWEGRVKSLLFSIGTNIDLRKLDHPFRSLGLEIQYSS